MRNFTHNTNSRAILIVAVVSFLLVACQPTNKQTSTEVPIKNSNQKPNIVFIFADDMGFGDIESYNPESGVPTPNLNTLASEGMSFTDAHSSSAVCTPSRYSVLTGRYAWRTKMKRGVFFGRAPLLIDPQRETLPSMLKRADYQTIMVGKWHLGLGADKPNFAGSLSPGPNAIGFDYFYGIPASLDMEPYVIVENDKVITPLLGERIDASDFRRNNGGGKWRKGELGDGFVHEEILPRLTDKAVEEIKGASKQDKPFFLYFSLTSPHTPWLPIDEYRGISEAGYYGDFAAYTDGIVGRITQAIKDAGIEENTIVIYSSDNGAHWKPEDKKKYAHRANGNWRGQKADIYEAGHRVPLIIKWPGKVKEQAVSNAQVVLNDVMRTVASIVNIEPAIGSAPDSDDFSSVLLNKADANEYRRTPMIHHSLQGKFAVRVGDWKLVEGLGSGGFTAPAQAKPAPGQSSYQLYNLAVDPQESNNIANSEPERVAELLTVLEDIRNNEG